MSLSQYGFALFIFILACLFALLCKYLFGRTKNRLQALDEKEKKLLAFYSTLEDMMDEFNDSAVLANTELAQHVSAMRNVAASLRTNPGQQTAPQTAPQPAPQHMAQPAAQPAPQPAPQPAVMPASSAQPQTQAAAMRQTMPTAAMRPRSGASNRAVNANATFDAPVFEVIGDNPLPEPTQLQEAATHAPKTNTDRPTRILTLHKNGMDRILIAKELSVTLSEVDLVLGIAGQR